MPKFKRRAIHFIYIIFCMIGTFPGQKAEAVPIGGFGLPLSHRDLAGGSVIDFETNEIGAASATFNYTDVSMAGNNVLRVTNAFNGSFNVTGNGMALTSNDRTQSVTFNFLSPVDAFGFNLGGTDLEWHLAAYSSTGTILDELSIPSYSDSNMGEWFGISAPGIVSARLFNTAFNIGSNQGTVDYVVLDNFTYVSAVPEPGTFILMGVGILIGLQRIRKNKWKK